MLRVTQLGAICEVHSTQLEFSIEEYVDLEDGRRIVWRADRGWSSSGDAGSLDPACHIHRECLGVLEGDGDTVYSYFDALMAVLDDLGLDVDPESVYVAPFRVDLGLQLVASLPTAARLVLASRSQEP